MENFNINWKDAIQLLGMVVGFVAFYFKNLNENNKKFNDMENRLTEIKNGLEKKLLKAEIQDEYHDKSISALQNKLDNLMIEVNKQSIRLTNIEVTLINIEKLLNKGE